MKVKGEKLDYTKYNFCISCEERYPKTQFKCSKCNRPIRSGPRAGIRKHSFIQRQEIEVKRY